MRDAVSGSFLALVTPLDPALRTAWMELAAIALIAAPVGVWALHRRALFAAEVLPHAMLPAAGLAAVLGAGITAGGAIGALLGAVAILALGGSRAGGTGLDNAATTVLGAATGIGTVLTLEASGARGLERLLFGDPLAAGTASAAVALAGALAVSLIAMAGHRAMLASTLGHDTARVAGVNPARIELAAVVTLAVAVTLAVGSVGAMLAFALIVGPAALATRGGKHVSSQIVAAAASGLVVVTGGLMLSASVDVPAGAAVALVAGLPAMGLLVAGR